MSNPRFRVIVIATTAMSLAVVGFSQLWQGATSDFRREQLVDGREIGALVQTAAPTAVLVYSLADVFGCSNAWLRWRALDAEGRVNVVLILAEQPSSTDLHGLKLRRIAFDGILHDQRWGIERPTPREYLIENDSLIRANFGPLRGGDRSPILRELENAHRPAPGN